MLFRRRYSLTIDDPCHESWQQMQPEGQGRYCGHCSKVVTDFTGKSEKEIAEFFQSRPQQVCGRFRQDQLQKTYAAPLMPIQPVHRRLSRYLLGLLLSGAAVEKAKAQEPVSTVQQNDSLIKDSALALTPAIQPDSLTLCDDTTQAARPADSLAADSFKINIDWEPGICITIPVTFTMTTITLGAISVAPPERINPLEYLLDSLALILRKARLKQASRKAYPTASLTVNTQSKPYGRRKAPLRLPAQEAILPIVSGWKSKKGGRVKSV